MEIINIPHRDRGVEYIAILAAVAAKNVSDVLPSQPLEIELKVNGVEVKFSAIAKELYERFEAMVAEEAAKLALSKIEGLADIEQMRWAIVQKINSIFDVKIEV